MNMSLKSAVTIAALQKLVRYQSSSQETTTPAHKSHDHKH